MCWLSEFDDVGIREGFAHHYPHTLVIGYDNNWTPSQRNATALLFSFGHTLALAKQLYGVIISSLCIFACFELWIDCICLIWYTNVFGVCYTYFEVLLWSVFVSGLHSSCTAPLNLRSLILLVMTVWSKENINTAALITTVQCNTHVVRCSRQLIGPVDWVFVTLGPLR